MDNTSNRTVRTTTDVKPGTEETQVTGASMTKRTSDVVSPFVEGNDKVSPDISSSVKASASHRETIIVPVHEEELIVHKREIESGRVAVKVQTTVEQQVIDVPLSRDLVEVERVPINRVVTEVTPPREEGDTTVIPVFEEILVVEKRIVAEASERSAQGTY